MLLWVKVSHCWDIHFIYLINSWGATSKENLEIVQLMRLYWYRAYHIKKSLPFLPTILAVIGLSHT